MLYTYKDKSVRSDLRELTNAEVIAITKTAMNTFPVLFTVTNENFFHVSSNLQYVTASYEENMTKLKNHWKKNFKKTNDNFWKVIEVE